MTPEPNVIEAQYRFGFYESFGYSSEHADETMGNIIDLREEVYGRELGWFCGVDEYDEHSAHVGIIDPFRTNGNPVFTSLRFIDGNLSASPLPCEIDFDLTLDDSDRNFEMSRFISRHCSDKIQSFGSFAVACFAVGFLIRQGATGYAVLEKPLIRLINKFGLKVEQISDYRVLSKYGSSENCVVRIHGEASLAKAREMHDRMPAYPNYRFFNLATELSGAELTDVIYRHLLSTGDLHEFAA